MEDKKQEKEVQCDPAPVEKQNNIPKKKSWIYVLAGVAIGVSAFAGGFCTRWYTIEKDMRTLINVKNKIDKEYYEDISDEMFYDAVFDAVNNEVLDKYSRYIRADECC